MDLPIKEVAADVFMITQTTGVAKSKFSVNVYVVPGEDGFVFDGGYGGKPQGRSLVRAIQTIIDRKTKENKPCSITRVLPSHGHWDHFSGLDYLRKRLGLTVCATQKQAEKIGSKKNYTKIFRVENPFTQNSRSGISRLWYRLKKKMIKEISMHLIKVRFVSGRINLLENHSRLVVNPGSRTPDTWEIIFLPGHSDDDIALYNKTRGILLGGDIVLRKVTSWLGPPNSNLSAYINSLETIKALPGLSLILTAHGSPIQDPITRIQAAIDHREKRTLQIFKMISDAGAGGIGYERIYQSYYPNVRGFQRSLFEGWICVTLEHLIEHKDIRAVPDRSQTRFVLA